MERRLRLFDIAANLSDATFRGKYYGKQKHECDLFSVFQRSKQVGCDRFLLAGGRAKDTIRSYEIAGQYEGCYTTLGVHPCRAAEVEPPTFVEELMTHYETMKDKIVAIGECGLDYDRFNYADKDTQMAVFPPHFDLAERTGLPMYLHSRATEGEFNRLIRENRSRFSGGVVHSFTGELEELNEILAMDLYIGVNGCSLKTQENIDVVKHIPLDKIMLETDCPYCEIRNSHASSKYVETKFQTKKKEKFNQEFMVNGRNEPAKIVQVLEAVSKILEVDKFELADVAYENSLKLFNLS